MKKTEFSKKILITAGLLNLIVVVFTLVMVWRMGDLTPLCYIVPATAAEVATGTAFYYNKAKLENRIKLVASYQIEPSEQAFSETMF